MRSFHGIKPLEIIISEYWQDMNLTATRETLLQQPELVFHSQVRANWIMQQQLKVLVLTKIITGSKAGCQMYLTTIKTGTYFQQALGLTVLQGFILIKGGDNSGLLVSAGGSPRKNSCKMLIG